MNIIPLGQFLQENSQFIETDAESAFWQFLKNHNKQSEFRPEFSIKQDDRLVLGLLVRKFNPKTVVETGTNWGASTIVIGLNSEAYIYTIDIGDSVPGPSQVNTVNFGRCFADTPMAYRIMKINSSTFDIKANSLPPADFWFIDSDHSMATVEHETNLAVKNMEKSGGVIVYHDARDGLSYDSDVFKFLTLRFPNDAVIIETTCGIAYVVIAGKNTVKDDAVVRREMATTFFSSVAAEAAEASYKERTNANRQIVALMMTKNEADIVGRALSKWKSWNIPIIAMDGSDDGTYEILKSYPNVSVYRDEDLIGKGVKGSLDWAYQLLLDKKRELFGSSGYVCLALGDEVWVHNPHKIIDLMEKEGATYAHGDSMQFFLHVSQKDEWDFEKKRWKSPKPPIERLKYYSPGWEEARIFRDDGNCRYRVGQAFDTMPEGVRIKKMSHNFTYAHYPMRDPMQILARAKDRVEREYQPIYQHSYNREASEVFFLTFPGLPSAKLYDGHFGEYEEGREYLK